MDMGMGMIEAIPFGFWKGDVADRPADNDKGAATAAAFRAPTRCNHSTLQRLSASRSPRDHARLCRDLLKRPCFSARLFSPASLGRTLLPHPSSLFSQRLTSTQPGQFPMPNKSGESTPPRRGTAGPQTEPHHVRSCRRIPRPCLTPGRKETTSLQESKSKLFSRIRSAEHAIYAFARPIPSTINCQETCLVGPALWSSSLEVTEQK